MPWRNSNHLRMIFVLASKLIYLPIDDVFWSRAGVHKVYGVQVEALAQLDGVAHCALEVVSLSSLLYDFGEYHSVAC